MPIRFQVDPDFYDHPKTLGISDAAVALWTRAGSYSTAKLLDGFVPDAMLPSLSRTSQEASEELVRHGLWRRVRGGFRFHQWDQRNLTRARVDADRDYDRERKRRERKAARSTSDGRISTPERQDIEAVDNEGDRDIHRAVKRGRNPNAEVMSGSVRTGQGPDGEPDSGRSPNRSVSVSVSESVSGSGQAHGAGPEPPPRCPTHLEDPSPPPCGPCADARRRHDRWELAEAERRRNAPQCRRHRGQPAHNCAPCRAERLAGGDA